MVVGKGVCGWNTQRQPFVVSALAYDTTSSVAHLNATSIGWRIAAHTYDLQVGHLPSSNGSLQARDWTKSAAVDVSSSFPASIKVSTGGIAGTLDCAKCETSGKLRFEMRVKTKYGVPYDAGIKIAPQDLSAVVKLKISATGTLQDKIFSKDFVPVSIPLDPIGIEGLLDVGPRVTFATGVEVSDLTASLDLTGGATASLPNGAMADLDFLQPSNNKFSGWTPSVSLLPFELDSRISTGLQLYEKVTFDIAAEALGW